MMKQILTAAWMSLFMLTTVVNAAAPDVAVQGPDGKAMYLHVVQKDGQAQVIIRTFPERTYLNGRTVTDLSTDQEIAPISTIEVPLNRLVNHLKLIMLSDRVVFSDEDVQADVNLYKKHGSLLNLEILNKRKASIAEKAEAEKAAIETELAASRQRDAEYAKIVTELGEENAPSYTSATPELENKLDATASTAKDKIAAVESLLADHDAAREAIMELDETLAALKEDLSNQTPDNPKRFVIKNGDVPAMEAVLLDAYRNDQTVPPVFVPIRVAPFMMGSKDEDRDNDEDPFLAELTQDIEVMATEVTDNQFAGLNLKGTKEDYNGKFKGPNKPRVYVNWHEAVAAADAMNAKNDGYKYSLMTEAQFEYVTRAGSTTAYCFGDDCEAGLDDYAWSRRNAEGRTHVVASKLANAFGVFDMHGNTWEWCSDWYGEYPSKPTTDPKGAKEEDSSDRVVRGGGWYSVARILRSADRFSWRPDFRFHDVGFRLVRTPL